jgi:hypothetical protein
MRRGAYFAADSDDAFLDAPDLEYERGRTWEQRLQSEGHDTTDLSSRADAALKRSSYRRASSTSRRDGCR